MTARDAGPTILALDASRAACSAAVLRNGQVVAEEGAGMARGQAEALLPMVERVLHGAGMDARDIAAIAVPVGPGSFTGIRIALSAARGFALATGATLIGIDGFRAAIESAGATRPALVAIETGRGDWFVRRFGAAAQQDTAAAQLGASDIEALIPAGAFDLLVPDELAAALTIPPNARRKNPDIARLASAAGRIAARILADGGSGPDGAALPIRPLYVAPPSVTMPGAS